MMMTRLFFSTGFPSSFAVPFPQSEPPVSDDPRHAVMLLRVHAAGGDASKRHRVHGLWDVNERHGERAYYVGSKICE